MIFTRLEIIGQKTNSKEKVTEENNLREQKLKGQPLQQIDVSQLRECFKVA